MSCRFFAWSRSFGVWSILLQWFGAWSRWAYSVAILRDHATELWFWTSFCRSPINRGEQILSLFCVITLIFDFHDYVSVISGKSGEADSVAILRDHSTKYNPVDIRLNFNRRCCRYNAAKRSVCLFFFNTHRRCCRFFTWSRSFLRFKDKHRKLILSIFCVITLPFIILA